MAVREIKTRLKLEGEQEFRRALNDAAGAVKTLNAEEKAAEAQFKASGDAAAYQQEKTRILNEKMAEQKKAVEAAQKAVKQLTEQGFAKNSREMQLWRTKLANAQTALAQTEGKLKTLQGSLDNTSTAMDNTSQAAADMKANLQSIGNQISVKGITDSIGKVEDTVRGTIKTVAGLGKKIWDLEADAASWADQVLTEAEQAGVDVETWQAWQYASEMVDTSVADILSATDRLNGKVLKESPQIAAALNQIGVAIADPDGTNRDPMEIFWDTVDALNAMDDVTERNNRAQLIFGNSYRNLVPLLNKGRGAWEGAVDEARRYYVLNEENVGKLGSLDDALNGLGAALTRSKLEILSALAPTFESIAGAMTDAVNAFNDFLATKEGQEMLTALAETVQELALELIKDGPDGFKHAISTAKDLVGGLNSAFKWIKDNKDGIKTALGVIAGGLAAIAAVKLASGIFEFVLNVKQLMMSGKAKAGKSLWDNFTDFFTGMLGGGGGEGGGGSGGSGLNPFAGGWGATDSANLSAVSTKTVEMRLALANIERDLERMAWWLENHGAVGAAAGARRSGHADWADLLSGGTSVSGYTGDVVRLPTGETVTVTGTTSGAVRSGSASGGGGVLSASIGSMFPEPEAGAIVEADPGEIAEQMAAELAHLQGYDLHDILTEETARMLYEGVDTAGTALEAEQIVPQVLAELTAFAAAAGDALPKLRRIGEEPEAETEPETRAPGEDEASGRVNPALLDTRLMSIIGSLDNTLRWMVMRADGYLSGTKAAADGILTEIQSRLPEEPADLSGVSGTLTTISTSVAAILALLTPDETTVDVELPDVTQVSMDLTPITTQLATLLADSTKIRSHTYNTRVYANNASEKLDGISGQLSVLTTLVGLLAPKVPGLDLPGVELPDVELPDVVAVSMDLEPVTTKLTEVVAALLPLTGINTRVGTIMMRGTSPAGLNVSVVRPMEPYLVQLFGAPWVTRTDPTATIAPETTAPETAAPEVDITVDTGAATEVETDIQEVKRKVGAVHDVAIVIPHWMEVLNADMKGMESSMNMLIDLQFPGADYGVNWGGFLNKPAFNGHSTTPDPISALADLAYMPRAGGNLMRGGARGGFASVDPITNWRPYGTGGRVDGEQLARIGEDGTEYVIPIGKPNRAFDLTMQMLEESAGLRQRVAAELASDSAALSSAYAAMAGAAGQRARYGGGSAAGYAPAGMGGGYAGQEAGGAGAPGGVMAKIYMDRREVGYMVADSVNEAMGARVSATRRGD